MNEKYIEFLKEYGLYDEEIFNYKKHIGMYMLLNNSPVWSVRGCILLTLPANNQTAG